MFWTLESWAYLKSDPGKAVKIFVKLPEAPDADKTFKHRGRATGLFRSSYQEWPDGTGEKITDPLGNVVTPREIAVQSGLVPTPEG